MTNDIFDEIVETQVMHSLDLLRKKGREYSPGGDRLEHFKKAAALQTCSPAKAAFGMLAKHLVSLSDMVDEPLAYSTERWAEKIGDSVNYLLILSALAEEGRGKDEEYRGRRLES